MDVFDQQGKRISLQKEVGRGGEATVYQVGNKPGSLAKIYTPAPRPNYPDKLDWMINHPPENPTRAQSHPSLAWPTELLFDSPGKNRRLIGYLMPHIQGAVAILDILNPRRRRTLLPRFDRRYLHRTARNLAAAISALHRCGYVVGDLNESNVLVTPSALITVIDTDSFQVIQRRNSRPVIYPCPVGKLEYTPPELQGQALDKVYRKPEHDSFSLAVLIFQMLAEGNHPFRAQWLGKGEPPPIEARIKSGAFPYTAAPGSLVKPPKGAPDFGHLHPAVAELFLRCFVDGHEEPRYRPDATAWERALSTAESALVNCSSGHLFSNHLAACPFCPPVKGRQTTGWRAPQRQQPVRENAARARTRTASQRGQQGRVRPNPGANQAGRGQAPSSAGPSWGWGGAGQSGGNLSTWLQNQLQQRVQNWVQSRVGVYGAPVFTPQPSTNTTSRAGGTQPSGNQPNSPAQTTAYTPTARPSVTPARSRRYPNRSLRLRSILGASLAYGAGTGALAGLLPGLLTALSSFYLLNSEPSWAFLWAFGGAAGAALRGTKVGHRLGLVIAQRLGWRRFWQGAGLIIGAALGGLISLPFALAIFPIFIGVISGARLGLETGNRIWLAGNRMGWEKLWMLTGGVTAALIGSSLAWFAGSGLPGELTSQLTGLATSALNDLQLALVWPAVAAGTLGGIWGGAFSGLVVDFFARITNLVD